MTPLAQTISSRRSAAWKAAMAVALLVAVLVPVTLERPEAAQGAVAALEHDDVASIRAEGEAFNGYPRLLAYVSARQTTATESEAADLAALRAMLDGYREVHEEIAGLMRAGQPAKAAGAARLAMSVLAEVRGSIGLVGTRMIGTDGTAPSPLHGTQPLAVAEK